MIATTRCRYAPLSELPVRDGATADRWLSAAERLMWQDMRSAERRATWLGGRIVAKRLVEQCLIDAEMHDDRLPGEIHIESHSDSDGLGRPPRVFVRSESLDWSVSISHTRRGVLAAVSTKPNVCLGVDLVIVGECRSEKLGWCFTPAEQRWIAGGNASHRTAQVWAVKEAVFKACLASEGFSPWEIEVINSSADGFSISNPAVRRLQCWRIDGHFAALVTADPSASQSVIDKSDILVRTHDD